MYPNPYREGLLQALRRPRSHPHSPSIRAVVPQINEEGASFHLRGVLPLELQRADPYFLNWSSRDEELQRPDPLPP